MKLAVVTGANSEIGTSICRRLLDLNYKVIACCHNSSDRIGAINNPNLEVRFVDLKDEKEIEAFSYNLDVDVLINVAAVYFDCDFQVKEKKDFMLCFEVNVIAPFLLAKYLKIKKNIVNISSTDGIDTYNVISMDYCASKAALNNLTKTLSLALPNINVVALALGWVKTDNEINHEYLKNEMKRTKQKNLIELSYIQKYIERILNNEYESGSIIRLDGVNEDVY